MCVNKWLLPGRKPRWRNVNSQHVKMQSHTKIWTSAKLWGSSKNYLLLIYSWGWCRSMPDMFYFFYLGQRWGDWRPQDYTHVFITPRVIFTYLFTFSLRFDHRGVSTFTWLACQRRIETHSHTWLGVFKPNIMNNLWKNDCHEYATFGSAKLNPDIQSAF